MSRLEKSPLLANGYNPPPHLNHMQFMQMNHHPGAMMSPNMPPHGMPRPDGTMMKGQPGMPPGMDAIARYVSTESAIIMYIYSFMNENHSCNTQAIYYM